MSLTFYPHPDDTENGTLEERIEILSEAAERYKAAVMELGAAKEVLDNTNNKRSVPRDLKIAYNWEEIARVLKEIKDMPEVSPSSKTKKVDLLKKLAEVYEVLRGAKMAKLEAVRLAIINEADQLKGGTEVA